MPGLSNQVYPPGSVRRLLALFLNYPEQLVLYLQRLLFLSYYNCCLFANKLVIVAKRIIIFPYLCPSN